MTSAEFLATIAAHPVAKYWRFISDTNMVVNFGDTCQVHSGSGKRADWICHKGVVGIASGTQTYHPSLTAALDAALAIIEPPKPTLPAGLVGRFVVVDRPVVAALKKPEPTP